MSDINKPIFTFGIIGELENEPIHYKEGLKYGNYLRYKNMNFSIHYKFNPITLGKAIKIINYKLEKINNNDKKDIE
jgi:hypothetical protein